MAAVAEPVVAKPAPRAARSSRDDADALYVSNLPFCEQEEIKKLFGAFGTVSSSP